MSSTDPRCSLQIRGVIYQYPWVSITDPRKKIKMLQTDPKKVPSQKYIFACSSRYNNLTFYEKKFPLHNPFKSALV